MICAARLVDYEERTGIKAVTEAPMPAPAFPLPLPLRFERRTLALWLLLNHATRWIILDLVRRYAKEIATYGDLAQAPRQARLRMFLRPTESSGQDGNIYVRLKRVSDNPYIAVAMTPTKGKIHAGTDGLLENKADKEVSVEVEQIWHAPVLSKPRPDLIAPEVDPVVRPLIVRIPREIRDDVLFEIALRDLSFPMTNGTGTNGNSDQPYLGIEARREKGQVTIRPIGKITDTIYFQNGWLMIKLANWPEALRSIIPGIPAGKLLSLEIPDAEGAAIDPFAGLQVSDTMTGKTWMGPHVMLRFQPMPPDSNRLS